MQEFYVNSRLEQLDLNLYECGEQHPMAISESYISNNFVLTYIIAGKGSISTSEHTHHVSEGNIFLTVPGIQYHFTSTPEEQWSCYWVGFYGLKAQPYLELANLTLQNPVLCYEKDDFIENCFREMIEARKMLHTKTIRMTGLLYIIFSHIIEKSQNIICQEKLADTKGHYIKKAIEFIENNYANNITVKEISHNVGLNRNYMSAMFREYFNTSLHNFLTNYRINRAIGLMKSTTLSIGAISRQVGYDDFPSFTRVFKKVKGLTPKKYKSALNLSFSTPLPSGWKCANIGYWRPSGFSSYSEGKFIVDVASDDLWNEEDSSHFVYTEVHGDFSITARVLLIQNTDAWAKAFVIMREKLEPGSRYIGVAATPSNMICCQWKPEEVSHSHSIEVRDVSIPVYLKLSRMGDDFTAFYSTDNKAWSEICCKSMDFRKDVYAGIAVCSHNYRQMCLAGFESVSVSSV